MLTNGFCVLYLHTEKGSLAEMKDRVQHYYKYNHLISTLRQKIFTGEFPCGSQLPPERKLAEMFNVSRITLRTALNELKNDGLIEQRAGVGTYVCGAKEKQEKEPQKKYRFCFFCNPSHMGLEPEADPYNSQLLLGIHKNRDAENNFLLDLRICPRGVLLETFLDERGESLSQWDGCIIACACTEKDTDYLLANKTNFVVLGESGSMRFYPAVTTDNFQAGYMLTAHLLQNGIRKPLFLLGTTENLWEQRRRAGFRQALLDAGVPCTEENFYGNGYPGLEETGELVGELLAEKERTFDALLLPNDVEAIGALNALKRHKIRVPEDMAVAVFDNYQWLANMYPGLPALVQPFAQLGEAAVELLLNQLRTPGAVTVKAIPPQLIPGNFKR